MEALHLDVAGGKVQAVTRGRGKGHVTPVVVMRLGGGGRVGVVLTRWRLGRK